MSKFDTFYFKTTNNYKIVDTKFNLILIFLVNSSTTFLALIGMYLIGISIIIAHMLIQN